MADGEPKRCSKCGYDLTGLPGVGACPECNELFNMFTGEGVRMPGVAGSDSDRALRRVKALVLMAIAVFLVICSGLIQLIFPHGHALVLGGVLAVLPVLWAVTTYMEDRTS